LETDEALKALGALSGTLPEPFLLMGGWAVYITVNDSFQKDQGSTYLGSRDIDVGFHIDPSWSEKELQSCTFFGAMKILEAEGYQRSGSFRFCKQICRTDGHVLTSQEQKCLPSYDILYLYVDMMVDNIHPLHKSVFQVDPIDESIIGKVAADGSAEAHRIGNSEMKIPPPHHLLASKLGSIPHRQHDDKLVKDACDIYSIIWYSSMDYREVIEKTKESYQDRCQQGRAAIIPSVARKAAFHLGIDDSTFFRVVDLLK
jgi:hypothetical protein